MNHINLLCELVSHQCLSRENAEKLGEGEEGTSDTTTLVPDGNVSPSPPANE